MDRRALLLEEVRESFDYFAWRVFELKTDDAHYIKAMQMYIKLLEENLKELQ